MFGAKQVLTRALQIQALFTNPPFISRFTHNQTASISRMNPDINRLLNFWFIERSSTDWFRPPAGFDEEIRNSFSPLMTQARSRELDSWRTDTNGSLALLLLLDQFPRNVFRGSGEAFATDALAKDVAVNAIAKGFDRETEPIRQVFFYLPLSHDEDLVSQVANCALMEACIARCPEDDAFAKFLTESHKFSKSHLDVIMKFGRFPARNKALGRESTEEEKTFLEENPSGFFSS